MRIDELLAAELKTLGRDLATSGAELRTFAAQQAILLVALTGQPGYDLAFRASTEMIAMKAGLKAIEAGDNADERGRRIIMAFLAGAASAS